MDTDTLVDEMSVDEVSVDEMSVGLHELSRNPLPVGSAAADKSFSAMRRTRNWLRSTMGEERFSSLTLLNIECDLTAALVPGDLVLTYANSGTRRLQLH